jgi:ABC-type multidrug transport system ATPase subunit
MKIEVRSLTKEYSGDRRALDRVDLTLEGPSMVGLVGPNGAGKTTLMKLLVAQLLPTAGQIHIDGDPLAAQEQAFKRRLGYLPQEFGLYEELTVTQFLDYLACLKDINSGRTEAIRRSVERTGLEDKAGAKIRTLSGGQKQRVGIAQALLNDPELLIIDEPTVGLDPEERIRFRNLFSRNASRQLVILSTHIIDDVESVCDRLIVLQRGIILFDGTPQELIQQADGHAAIIEVDSSSDRQIEDRFRLTSRVITPEGARCRIVGDVLPPASRAVPPTLEDAYIYCMMQGEAGE